MTKKELRQPAGVFLTAIMIKNNLKWIGEQHILVSAKIAKNLNGRRQNKTYDSRQEYFRQQKQLKILTLTASKNWKNRLTVVVCPYVSETPESVAVAVVAGVHSSAADHCRLERWAAVAHICVSGPIFPCISLPLPAASRNTHPPLLQGPFSINDQIIPSLHSAIVFLPNMTLVMSTLYKKSLISISFGTNSGHSFNSRNRTNSHYYTLSETWSGVNWADLMAAQGSFGTDFYDRSILRPKHRAYYRSGRPVRSQRRPWLPWDPSSSLRSKPRREYTVEYLLSNHQSRLQCAKDPTMS